MTVTLSVFLRARPLAAVSAIAIASLSLPYAGTHAQTVTSRPVTQPLPSQDTQRLNRALIELAKAPQSVPALLEAGNAALAVNDLDAALGFFERLIEVEPENEPATLGLARVYLRSGRPIKALLYFDKAQSRGAEPLAIGSDFALTLDLLGAQEAAQTEYIRLIEVSPKDSEARRRLAVSYAISGNAPAFETTLRPLVERRDFAAFRARAFGLAIMGEQDRASAIAEAVMPPVLAQKITPYLEFMPRLTPAQQAAAANLGVFPRAADIGRDPPAIAAYASNAAGSTARPLPRSTARLDQRLAPMGAPLGAADGPASPSADQATDTTQAGTEPTGEVTETERQNADEASVTQTQAGLASPSVAKDTAIAASDENPTQLASSEDEASAASPSEESLPEPKTPDHPSRIWVQLATGRDLTALGFDWRRFARKAPDLLAEYAAHTVPWGEANRLLAGPLENREEARELINALKRKGLDSFRYTSPEGMEIQELKTP